VSSLRNNTKGPDKANATRWQMAARAALEAGGATALRLRKEPGSWTGDKGAKVATAALGAAAIDAFIDVRTPLTPISPVGLRPLIDEWLLTTASEERPPEVARGWYKGHGHNCYYWHARITTDGFQEQHNPERQTQIRVLRGIIAGSIQHSANDLSFQ
jgi:hypothetical protein